MKRRYILGIALIVSIFFALFTIGEPVFSTSFTKTEIDTRVVNGRIEPVKKEVIDWSGVLSFALRLAVIFAIGSWIGSKCKSNKNNRPTEIETPRKNNNGLNTTKNNSVPHDYKPPKNNSDAAQTQNNPVDPYDDSKIKSEAQKVIKCIGISEKIDAGPIIELVRENKLKSAAMSIAKQLSLDDLNITIYRKKDIKLSEDGKHHTLADVDTSDVGVFGTSHFKTRPCRINIYPGSEDSPETFIMVIAHELCHIVLHSVKTVEKETNDEERLTDLAVIFSGFIDVYGKGRKNEENNSTAGYLSDDDFVAVSKIYNYSLKKAIESRKLLKYEYEEIMDSNEDKIRFIKMVTMFLRNRRPKMHPEDVSSIGLCISAINKQQAIQIINSIREINKELKSKRYKTDKVCDTKIKALNEALNSINVPDYEYVSVLGKYINN